MIKIQEIKELIKAIDKSTVDLVKIEQDGTKLTIKRNTGQSLNTQVGEAPQVQEVVQQTAPQQVEKPVVDTNEKPTEIPVQSEPKDNDTHVTINSPMVGTFYAAPAPDADPYVKTGDQVNESTVVCIVEAMKLMNEIEAEVKGKIVDILVQNGELVEYGQPLFVVQPD